MSLNCTAMVEKVGVERSILRHVIVVCMYQMNFDATNPTIF